MIETARELGELAESKRDHHLRLVSHDARITKVEDRVNKLYIILAAICVGGSAAGSAAGTILAKLLGA